MFSPDELSFVGEYRRPGDEPDLSWVLVAVDRFGCGYVLDAARGFFEEGLLYSPDLGYSLFEDPVPGTKVGIYRIENVRIAEDDYGCASATGDWKPLLVFAHDRLPDREGWWY